MSPMSPRTLRPRRGGFNPLSLPGLRVWHDVASLSSMTFNAGTVSQINDLSGNGFHATQGTANNQPTYQATGFNGRPTLSFDTTDSLLSLASLADIIASPTTSPAVVFVMACYMPLITNSGAIIFGSDAQANGRLLFNSHFGGSSIILDTVNATTGRVLVGGQTDTGWTTPHILTIFRIGATMSVRRNGAEVAGRTNASGNYSTTTARLQIGKTDGSGSNAMFLSEWLTYASPLTIPQIQTAERGLGAKWGVTVA